MRQTRQDLEKIYHRYNDLSIPDANFNPAQAKSVIEETIRSAETFHKNESAKIDEALGERIDVVSSYGCYRFNRGHQSIEKYLGRKMYESLIGEKLMEKIRIMDTVNRLNGNTKFRKSVLL